MIKMSFRVFLKKRTIILLFIYCFLLIPISIYSRGSSEESKKEEIVFWHSIGTYNKDILNRLIDEYNTKHPKPSIRGVFQGNEEDLYFNLLSQENLPDIVHIPVQFLHPLLEKKLIINLEPFISQKLKNDISSKFWESVIVQDDIYGMPFFYNVNIFYVNQRILRIAGVSREGEPRSWEEMLSVISRIKRNAADRHSFFIPLESLAQFISFIESYTGTSVIEDGRIVVNKEEVVSAMRFLQEAVYTHEYMPSKITTDEGIQMFLSGNLGLLLGSSSMLVYTESNLPYDLNVWHLPVWEKAGPTVFGTCLAIVRSNARQEREAFKFIDYIVDYEQAIKWHTHTGNPAIRSSVKKSLDLLIFYEENPNYMASVIELESGRVFSPSFDYFSVSDIIKNALEEIMVNREDPEAVLNRAQKNIDQQ
ncbi:MAG: extracellular solute-binding protein [Spirochaetota bacterium]|nr:MAG: extracellular solute-binding protein [Spirochaetota bacterium]